ncbi:DUF1488 family protein [Paraburkholderia hospita]|uniref:DUF1488 family protein n=1 Tax=Paraburkholderia hospita TaxID=169430 RepID=UPI000DEF9056|nr:DUF1488 family protein [Paraburkholderia hospita]AXF05774.1 DUF1488 domain-containing protein [Paraburkholderia hospita]
MEFVELEPHVLADRRGVVFGLVRPNGTVQCVITLTTLERHFWLEPGAGDTRILKTFRDGYSRIRAIAERRLLAHPAARLELTPEDFARPDGGR